MQPEDLSQLNVPSDPQVHRDGLRFAFVLTRMDLDEDVIILQCRLRHLAEAQGALLPVIVENEGLHDGSNGVLLVMGSPVLVAAAAGAFVGNQEFRSEAMRDLNPRVYEIAIDFD